MLKAEKVIMTEWYKLRYEETFLEECILNYEQIMQAYENTAGNIEGIIICMKAMNIEEKGIRELELAKILIRRRQGNVETHYNRN